MNKGRKFQIKPSAEQASKLRAWIGCQRKIYNEKVGDMNYQLRLRSLYKRQHPELEPKEIGFVEFNAEYSRFFSKGETDYLKDVPSQILRQGAFRFIVAIQRWKAKLAEKPKTKKKHGRQSVMITSELFSIDGNILKLGTKKFPVGNIKINAHIEFDIPKMVSISADGNRWFISFCNDDGYPEPSYKELLDRNIKQSKEYLLENGIGIDRGINVNAACSNNVNFVYSVNEVNSLLKAQANKKRYQRQMARRHVQGAKKQSKNYYRAKASKQKAERKVRNIRLDFNHKTSHTIANSDKRIICFENLKLKNMTKAPEPKQDENGNYLPNGAAAKAGLNKAILNVALGQMIQFTKYKAIRNYSLVLQPPAFYTSQKCRKCKYIDKGNRISQSVFSCLKCGHTENADTNAGHNILEDGVDLLLSGYFHEQLSKKAKKVVRVGRNAQCHVETETGLCPA